MFEKYTVVRGRSVTELVDEVNKALKEDWEPQGSVAFDGIFHLQAMLKIVEDD